MIDEGLVLNHPSLISATLYAGRWHGRWYPSRTGLPSRCEPVTLPAHLLIRQKRHPRSPQAAKPILHSYILQSKKQSKISRAARIKMNFLFLWSFFPPRRVKYVQGRTAPLFVFAWWELLNYHWMFLIRTHSSAYGALGPHVPHRPAG